MSLRKSPGPLVVSLVVLGAFLYVAGELQTWAARAQLFGSTIVIPAIALAAVQVAREARRTGPPLAIPTEAVVRRSALLWFAGFYGLLWLIGLTPTIPLFSALYLRIGARESWPKAILYAVLAWAFAEILFVRVLHVPLPDGVIALPVAAP